MEHINVMKAIFIIYGIPLVALLIGASLSFYSLKAYGIIGTKQEVISFFVGLIFTALAYLGIRTRDSKFRESRKYMPTVTRILFDEGNHKDVE